MGLLPFEIFFIVQCWDRLKVYPRAVGVNMVHKTDSGNYFFVSIFRVFQMTITRIFPKTTTRWTPIDPVFCHHIAYI